VTGGAERLVHVDQKRAPGLPGGFVSLGTFTLPQGDAATVTISNKGTQGHVIVDALQVVPAR
jgi:hypothetical protein